MKRETLDEFLARVNSIDHYTLRGGNDPDDAGDVRAAVAQLCELIRDILMNMPEER